MIDDEAEIATLIADTLGRFGYLCDVALPLWRSGELRVVERRSPRDR